MNAIGYTGNPTISSTVSHDPLGSVVPNRIVLTAQSVSDATDTLQLPPWNQLNQSQKKMVTAYVLQQRGTPVAAAQANQVLMANPAFQAVEIIWAAASL